MLNRLSYRVTFPTTGRTLTGEHHFQAGFGVITGPNEQGKSFIIEVARWCLFGSLALRGKADDYKTLTATLEFTTRGQTYVVERSFTTAKLTSGSTVLCTGTTPVNKHIPTLLGFGLDVFDVACAANQGDIERLGNLRPAERKRMVDSVIGLDRIEEVGKWAGEEARGYEKQVEALQRKAGTEPMPPSEPFDQRALEVASDAHAELHRLRGITSIKREKPNKPTCCIEMTAEQLRPLATAEQERNAEIKLLQARLKALPQPSPHTDEELESQERLLNGHLRWQFEKRHPVPIYPRAALETMLDAWSLVEKRQSLDRLIRELESHGEIDCPNCRHHFYLESGKIDDLRAKLQALPEVEQPDLTRALIGPEIAKHDDWDRHDTRAEWEEVKDFALVPIPPKLDQRAIDRHRRANAAAADRAEIEACLGPPSDDMTNRFQTRLTYEAELLTFEQSLREYQAWAQEQAIAETRIAELEPVAARLGRLTELRIEWERFRGLSEAWERSCREVAIAQVQGQGWRKAQAALTALRSMVKGHLVPALSRVASGLIAQMTGGQRSLIVVDQEFDVTVDGQRLDTLSGSGKALANLALRLGLGQVLTNNVLSLFIGDEIDASIDETRADSLGDTVRRLTSRISQIVLITHKQSVQADWQINL